jgi:hypothetical protein
VAGCGLVSPGAWRCWLPTLAPGKPARYAEVRCPERAHRDWAVTVLFPVRPARPGG